MAMADCPICDGSANVVGDLSEEGIRFECKECGSYGISDSSAMTIQRYNGAVRRGLLAAALFRAAPGSAPFISHTD